MKLVIERHTCAPELNKVHIYHNSVLKGTIMAKHITTIEEARKKLFKRIVPGKVAIINTEYDDEKYKGLNRQYKGRIANYTELLNFIDNKVKPKCDGGELISGELIPPARIKVKTCLVG